MLAPATVGHWHHRLPGRLVRSNTWLSTEEEGERAGGCGQEEEEEEE